MFSNIYLKNHEAKFLEEITQKKRGSGQEKGSGRGRETYVFFTWPYRPISVLPIISEIFEQEIFQQLYKCMNENDIISKFQSGFWPGYSTLSALIQMCDAWFNNMDDGESTGVVFLDIQKAFDSIDHNILLDKLKFYGILHLNGFNHI